jgi:hypothetical protein
MKKLHDALEADGYLGASVNQERAISPRPVERELAQTAASVRRLLATPPAHAGAKHRITQNVAGHEA